MSVATTSELSPSVWAAVEVTLEGDGHGEVADTVPAGLAQDADDADGRLAVTVRAEFDHAWSSIGSAVRVAYRARAMSTTASSARAISASRSARSAAVISGSSCRSRPPGDEDAVAEPEACLVRGVQPVELRGHARPVGFGIGGRAIGRVAIVALLDERQRRDARRRRPEPRVGVDELDLLVERHRVGDLTRGAEHHLDRAERAGHREATEEPRAPSNSGATDAAKAPGPMTSRVSMSSEAAEVGAAGVRSAAGDPVITSHRPRG